MHAVVLPEYGHAHEVLRFSTDVAEPAVPDGWVLVELKAAALNNHDRGTCLGRFGSPLPHVIGSDGAGIRRDTGAEVIINPMLFWGDREDAPADGWEILGDKTSGTFAELVAVPAELVHPKPAGMSWHEAAALPLAGLTAHRALFGRGTLRAGENVVILGAGSGVSTIAIAFARMAGARVFVTSSSVEKILKARELGAAGGVLYTQDGWVDELRELIGGGGTDLVIDSIGTTLPDSLALTRPGGRVVMFGVTGGPTAEIDVRSFFFSQRTILATTMGSPRDFAAMVALLQANPGWAPIVDSVYPLADAAQALGALGEHQHFGKLVLEL